MEQPAKPIKIEPHLPSQTGRIIIGVIGATAFICMIVAVIPINQWNVGTMASGVEAEAGLFEVVLTYRGETQTIKYADSPSTSAQADAGTAAFALLLVAKILIAFAVIAVQFQSVIVPKLPEPFMACALPLALAFVAFILELSAWANWASEIGNDGLDYGLQFAIAIVAWILILAFMALLAFATFQAWKEPGGVTVEATAVQVLPAMGAVDVVTDANDEATKVEAAPAPAQ